MRQDCRTALVKTHTAGLIGSLSSELVCAPRDDEVYGYLGPQHRWVQVLMTCAFLLAGVSLFRFSVSGSVWLWPMLGVLGINIVGVGISAFSGLNARRVTRASHEAMIREWSPLTVPSVDVFLPTCGEPMAILENTYRHVSTVAWEGQLVVWVLDDADRLEVRDAAARFGFEYRVRPDRGHMKKAGNLRYGFHESSGDLIVILDADFCPRADFLDHLVPYMDDPSVGIVQSPQVFDTTTEMSWLQRGAGATQELFYRWIQPSRDRAGAPICVGTCAVYRRAALASVGGFAQIEHSEDVHTGILLLRAGHATRYVPAVIAKGLCPNDLAGFLSQQYRWCNGSITLLQSTDANRRPLTIRQRICFWSGFMYYIGTAVNVFTLHIPGIAMALFYSQNVRASDYVPFLAGVWVYFVLLPMVFKARWRFEVLRVQMAYSFCHAVAVAHRLTGRSAGWVATGAVSGSSGLARTISKVGLVGIIVPLALCWAGILYDVPRYGLHEFWPMVLFVGGYTYLSVPLAVAFARVLHPRGDARSRGPKADKRRWAPIGSPAPAAPHPTR
jgi:cellulose synthase (UDP-forming)